MKNVLKNINKLKKEKKIIVGFGSPAKATTALNFFGISDQIDCIFEDNNLKVGKYVPGVKILIKKKKPLDDNHCILVLAWNFYEVIKKRNKNLSNHFINIKELEK